MAIWPSGVVTGIMGHSELKLLNLNHLDARQLAQVFRIWKSLLTRTVELSTARDAVPPHLRASIQCSILQVCGREGEQGKAAVN